MISKFPFAVIQFPRFKEEKIVLFYPAFPKVADDKIEKVFSGNVLRID
jgi:hypothetical protein